MKGHLLKSIENMAVSFNPETLIIAKQADMKFYHTLPDIVKMCQEFGMVFSYSLYPEKCRASGEGINIATNGETSCVSVEVFDGEGEAYLTPVDDLKYELRGNDGSLHVCGTGTRRYHNVYDIGYEPHASGLYKLDIRVEGRPIFNSPFSVTVLPAFIEAAECIEDVKEPIGIAVMDGEEGLVVAEYGNHCVSIINRDREKETSFGTRGSASGQFDKPEGVAIDHKRNILVADLDNHRIQQFSSAGEFLRSVGQYGSRPLQFKFPRDVTVHPHTHKVYIADWGNHRIQILNPELTYFSSFGRIGCGKGEFNGPCDIATDLEGNLYVADCDNHRIQVFTVDGVYLRQFGKKGERDGELKWPVSVAVDSCNIVYVGERGNNRVSIFFTSGEFIKSFGEEGYVTIRCPFGLATDNGIVYVCDTNNHRIQIFE